MVTILVGCAAVWAMVTTLTGGNWQGGGVCALLVLGLAVSGLRSMERRAANETEYMVVRKPVEEPRGWWHR